MHVLTQTMPSHAEKTLFASSVSEVETKRKAFESNDETGFRFEAAKEPNHVGRWKELEVGTHLDNFMIFIVPLQESDDEKGLP